MSGKPGGKVYSRLSPPAFRRCGGFTYIGLLIAIAVMGIMISATSDVWFITQTREKEKELLFIGDQFRRAITAYHRAGGTFPQNLDDMVKDPRQPSIQRYLRKVFVDPMTGKAEWGIVRATNGGIMGVFSLSKGTPLKTKNFPQLDKAFEGATSYDQWIFMYGRQASQATAPPDLPPTGTSNGQYSPFWVPQ